MSQLGQLAASTTTTITSPFCPQYMTFNAATVPTSIKVNVKGSGISMDLATGALITEINGWRKMGNVSNEYTFILADGLIEKTTDITIANSVAGTIDVFGNSTDEGDNLFVYSTETILANSGTPFVDFAMLAVDAFTTTDSMVIQFASGVTETVSSQELNAWLQFYQASVAGIMLLDNMDGILSKVTVIPSAQRSAILCTIQGVDTEIN